MPSVAGGILSPMEISISGKLEWNDNEPIEVTCPECGTLSTPTWGGLSSGTAKCPGCGVVFDGRGIKRQIEDEIKKAFGGLF
jgi:hypothetical protein